MTWATEMAVGELEIWEKVVIGNARLIATMFIKSQLGPVVLTPDIVENLDKADEYTYGINIDMLQNSVHSN